MCFCWPATYFDGTVVISRGQQWMSVPGNRLDNGLFMLGYLPRGLKGRWPMSGRVGWHDTMTKEVLSGRYCFYFFNRNLER